MRADLAQRAYSPLLEKILSRLTDVMFGVDRPRVPAHWCAPPPSSRAFTPAEAVHARFFVCATIVSSQLKHVAIRPSSHWESIIQILQSAVPSATSLPQAVQSLNPNPTPASKFLLNLASSRNVSAPDCGTVAHAACSVLLRAMRAMPSAAAAIVNILCVDLHSAYPRIIISFYLS